jgi:hypothetical protein
LWQFASLPVCEAFTFNLTRNITNHGGAPATVFFKGHASVDEAILDK